MKKIQYFVTGSAILLPFIASAQTTMTLNDLIAKIAGYMTQILALLMGFAVLAFVFYVIKYFIQPSDVKRTEAAAYVMWSVIGFFVILSLWGIVNILISTFDLGTNSPASWAGLKNLFPSN